MRLVSIWLITVLLTAMARVSMADVIVLKDGSRLEGDVKRSAGGWQVTTADGKTIQVAAEKVKAIEVGQSGNGRNPNDQAASGLLSLRRSVENVADLKQIIDRFKRFIEQYKATPSAADAQKDLAMWQERLDRGLVKLGSRWVTEQERTELADKALAVADQARELVARGRLHDADAMLVQAIEWDPQCPPALYLRGVILYQQSQLPAARKHFESVAGLIHDHAPTINNIAVILWRQNAVMPAVAKYDQAMTAAPANKIILDNVSEALAALQENDRKNRVAQGAFRRFTEQDANLQQALAAQGLYRWGGTWVDRATMEQFRDLEKQMNEKIAAARTEADAAEKLVRAIDTQLDSVDRSMRQIESDSISRNADGKLVRLPYPPYYYDLQNEAIRLRSERTAQVNKANGALAQIKSLQADLPKPKFTGIQQLIGAEGAPVMIQPAQSLPTAVRERPIEPPEMPPEPMPASPASQPVTQPSEQDPQIPVPAWPRSTGAPAEPPSSQPASTQPAGT